MTTFEALHPRETRSGMFTDKDHSAPEGDVLTAVRPLSERFDTLDDKLEAMRTEIDDAVAKLQTDEGWNRYLDSMGRFHNYSFGNQLLIGVQMPEASKVAGVKTWNGLGRKITKGERGLAILAPKRAWVKLQDKSGNPLLDENGKPRREKRTIGFTSAAVFDISQTEGDPLPEGGYADLVEEPPEGFIEDLEAAIADRGFTLVYADELSRGERHYGATSPSTKKVTIKNGLPAGERASVLAHELGHIAAGHLDHMEDYHTGGTGKRGAFEVEAESISHVLLRANGMQSSADGASRYVAGWATVQKDDPSVVRAAGETVAKAVKELIGAGNWSNLAV